MFSFYFVPFKNGRQDICRPFYNFLFYNSSKGRISLAKQISLAARRISYAIRHISPQQHHRCLLLYLPLRRTLQDRGSFCGSCLSAQPTRSTGGNSVSPVCPLPLSEGTKGLVLRINPKFYLPLRRTLPFFRPVKLPFSTAIPPLTLFPIKTLF